MVMLAEQYDYVIGGDPDRDTIDLVVLDTGAGRVRAHVAETADGPGYQRMLAWVGEHAAGRRIWALEGTGSFAAGLVVFLLAAGETVVEVGALKRARGPTNDRIDAIRAARQALSRDEQGAPRSGGLREALRMIFACREGVLVSRTKAINELKSLIVVAPEHLRAQLRGCSLIVQLAHIEQLQIPADAPVEYHLSAFSLRSVAARVRFLFTQLAELDPQLLDVIKQHPAGPTLLAEAGVGPVVAAQLLISWSHHGRVRNEAAFASLAGVCPLETSTANAPGTGSTAAATEHRTAPYTSSRSPGCDATLRPAPTRRDAPPTARPIATSDAPSNARSPVASTERSRPPSDSTTPPSPLDKHRSVQRVAPAVLPEGHRPVEVVGRGDRSCRLRPEHQATQDPRMEDPGRGVQRNTHYRSNKLVLLPPVESGQYTSLRFTEHLALKGIAPSIGTVGDAYDNCLMESIIGLQDRMRPPRTVPRRAATHDKRVEFATMACVDWWNNRRLHSTIGMLTPAEHEQAHYAATAALHQELQPT